LKTRRSDWVLNATSLLSGPFAGLRRNALEILEAGLEALDTDSALERWVQRRNDTLVVGGRSYPIRRNKTFVVGAGKASYRIAAGLEELIGDFLAGGLVVVPRGEGAPLERIKVLEADHPIPSEASLVAGLELLEMAQQVTAEDLVFCCITGGSSALVSVPPSTVSFEEKQRLHEVLLASGAPIQEINAVRKHVSAIKGGRLAERLSPARIVNVTISDVSGDPADCITDPTVQDTSTVGNAVEVLRRYELWDGVPPSIRHHLESPQARSPDVTSGDIHTAIIVTGRLACDAMVARAQALEHAGLALPAPVTGEAVVVGRDLANLALDCLHAGDPLPPPCAVVGCGGETTVGLHSWAEAHGGGPNQELALAAATELEAKSPVVLISIDTDGADGGTTYAGAIVDGATLSTIGKENAQDALRTHRSSKVLQDSNHLIVTGPTSTNANDLFVLVVGSMDSISAGAEPQ
jgi:glycerate 2-kinase